MNTKRIPSKERASYKAYHRFNHVQFEQAKNHMIEKFGEKWLYLDPANLHIRAITDYQMIATIFAIGYDKISVNDDSLRPMIEDYHENYTIKRKWLDYVNNWIIDMLEQHGHDSEVFLYLYTNFDKERWGGMEQWKILSTGVERGNLVMSALKNLCFYRHLEGRTVTFKVAQMINSALHDSLYWTFNPEVKVLYDESKTEEEIYRILCDEKVTASNFVRAMLLCKQTEAYAVIADEVHKRFPDEYPASK